jgi:hypothetical protein
MSDFDKGRRNDTSNVSDWREFEAGRAHQKNLNAMADGGLASPGRGMVITGESPILQFIVRIPFLLAGTLLYPLTFAVALVAGLLCVRLVPLFGADAGWQRLLAFVPVLAVFWFCLRWDVRLGERNPAYRRVRHVARILLFAALGYWASGVLPMGDAAAGPLSAWRLGGAVAGAVLGYLMLRADGWRNFWYATLAAFRIRSNDIRSNDRSND